MTRRRKRILWAIGITLLMPVIGLLLLPIWFPWALPAVASRFGADYESYEKIGYNRFALHHFTYTNERVRFIAERIETAVPSALLWNHVRTNGSQAEIENWSLTVSEEKKSTNRSTNTPAAAVSKLEGPLEKLSDWFSRAALTNGVVKFQQQTASVPWLVLEGSAINGRFVPTLPKLGALPLAVSLQVRQTGTLSANVAAPGIDFRSTLVATRTNGELAVSATNFWNTNRILLQARFSDNLLPEWAHLSAPALAVTNLPGYQALNTQVDGAWTNGTFTIAITFTGAGDRTNLPAISGTALAHGDMNSATLDEFAIESPAWRADLSRPVRFNYQGEWLSGAARLSLTGNLSRLPIENLRGAVRGAVEVEPPNGRFPQVNLKLAATDIAMRGLELAKADMTGELRWPVLRDLEVQAKLASGGEIAASVTADLSRRFVSNATVQVTGWLPTNFVPALGYSNLAVRAELSGPLTNLQHHAIATVERVNVPTLVPLNIELRERGQQFEIGEFRGFASGKETALGLSGSGEWTGTNVRARFSAINLWTGAVTRARETFFRGSGAELPALFSLGDPVTIQLFPRSNAASRFAMTPLHWRGDGRELTIETDTVWPASGSVHLSAAGLRSADLTNLFASAVAMEILVRDFAMAAQWSNGPVAVSFNTVTEISTTNVPRVRVTAMATNDAEALHITRLEAAVGSGGHTPSSKTLMAGGAIVPVTVLGQTNGFSFLIDSNAPLRVELRTATNDVLRDLLAKFAKVNVTEPSLEVALGGTIKHPQGTIHVSARSVASRSITNRRLPKVERLRADITLDPTHARVRELRATLAGQPFLASAEIPISDGAGWTSRLRWDQARASLQLPSAKISAFAALATNVVAPRGTLSVALTLNPGMQLDGQIEVTNAATPPLLGIGPIYDIAASIRLRDGTAIIRRIGAHAAGAPLVVTGLVNFAGWQPATNHWPDMRLRIAGTNVALVRGSQKIIRSDLNLQITNKANSVPAISGEVRLRDSLFLANLTDLVPGGVTKPSQRPPYFSVNAPLVRDWPLDVHVQGDKFLTVRTPFFRGEVSAKLDVRGHLAEPLADGEVRIGSGTIAFPFATLSVKQGFVTLSSANAYQPRLFVTAAGRAYDYDIKLEVSGNAQKPILEFTSVPGLTSEQILLMVTSGQIPRTDYTLSSGQRAQNLGMFVGKNVLSQFGLGGTGEKLTMRSGENISESGRPTYAVEYKLTEDVWLVGEYDRFDDYNAGIKWRVYKK